MNAQDFQKQAERVRLYHAWKAEADRLTKMIDALDENIKATRNGADTYVGRVEVAVNGHYESLGKRDIEGPIKEILYNQRASILRSIDAL